MNRDTATDSRLTPQEWVRRGFFVALGVALLYAVASAVRDFGVAVLAISTPFVAGAAIAVLIDPIIRWVEKWGLRRGFAVFIVFGLFVLLVVGAAYATIPALINQAGALSTAGPASVASFWSRFQHFLDTHHKIGPFKLPRNSDALVAKASDTLSAAIQKSAGNIAEVLIGSASIVIQVVVTVVVTFYVLMDYDRLRARFYFLVPVPYRRQVRSVLGDVGGVFAQYIRGLVIECTIFGVCMVILLESLSFVHPKMMESALLVGVLAGVLYAVPYVGALTITLLTFIVSFGAGGFWFAVIAAGCSLFINQAFDYVVTPHVIGAGVGLHPIAALFALALGAELFQNVWGLILSVPVAGSVQVILYRLMPKLCEPTPADILQAEGVRPDDPEIPKIPLGNPEPGDDR